MADQAAVNATIPMNRQLGLRVASRRSLTSAASSSYCRCMDLRFWILDHYCPVVCQVTILSYAMGLSDRNPGYLKKAENIGVFLILVALRICQISTSCAETLRP